MIIVDASAVGEALVGAPAATGRLAGERLLAPHLIDAEVANAIRKSWLRGRLTRERAEAALETYAETDIVRIPHTSLLDRAWQLRDNVTTYDAMYIALAEWFGLTLVTADARLAAAPGIKATVEVLPVSNG